MPLITIVTTTYNRAAFLPRLYESLCQQTCKNFEWLVIDDGSSDNSQFIIHNLKLSAPFPIKCVYKENGGKHTALNVAFGMVQTELMFIVDSDDELAPDAIETIERDWEEAKSLKTERRLCGIGYLRGYGSGKLIGDKYSDDYFVSDFIEERYNHGINGDKAEVWVTDCLRDFRFLEYTGEKFISESVAWIWLAERYDMLFVNKIIYITEYLEGGLSNNGRRLRFLCPHLMAYGSLMTMTSRFRLTIRLKETLLYIVYSLFGRFGWHKIFSCKYKSLVCLCAAPGWLLYKVWKKKYKL